MQPEDNPRAVPWTVALYGQEGKHQALADELVLDGFDVRLVSHPADMGGVKLIVFAHTSDRGAGLKALRALRQDTLAGSGAPVLWMSQSDSTTDTLRAFEAGADDVLRAPSTYAELVARVRALLRRAHPPAPDVIQHGALRIDTRQYRVAYDGQSIRLRRLEYRLLVHLARDPHRLHTKHDLLRDVWGYQANVATRTVDAHVSRLRKALARAGAEGWIGVEHGIGYRLLPLIQPPRQERP